MGKLLAWSCLLALLTMASVSQAQDSACLNQLVPCLEYTSSQKTPSKSCCDPLKSLIKSDPQCLCSLLGSNSAAKQAGVNATQAQLLPARCGEKVNAALCSSLSKTKNKVSSSGVGRIPMSNAAMVSVLFLIVQAIWLS